MSAAQSRRDAVALYGRVVSHLARIDAFLALVSRSSDSVISREAFGVASGCIEAYARFARTDLMELAAKALSIKPDESRAMFELAHLESREQVGIIGVTAKEAFGGAARKDEESA